MKLPLQITFQNMESSDALEADIREHAEKLDIFYEKIMSIGLRTICFSPIIRINSIISLLRTR